MLVILAISLGAYFQLRYWQNSLTLFQHALDVTKNNYTAHTCIAECLSKKDRINEAIYHYSQAIYIKPDNWWANLGMGFFLRDAGRLDEAAEQYRKCLRIKPDDPNALNGLGVSLGQQGKLDQAVKYLTDAVRIKPDYTEAYTNLGFALILQGNPDKAAIPLTEAIRISPDSASAHYYFAQVMAKKDKINEAVEHFENAIRLKLDWAEPMNELAWYLAAGKDSAIRNPDKAVKLALRACELTDYKKPELLDTLAVAYAATGDFNKAVETEEKALKICQSPEQETLKKEIENHLVLFKAGKPYIIEKQ